MVPQRTHGRRPCGCRDGRGGRARARRAARPIGEEAERLDGGPEQRHDRRADAGGHVHHAGVARDRDARRAPGAGRRSPGGRTARPRSRPRRRRPGPRPRRRPRSSGPPTTSTWRAPRRKPWRAPASARPAIAWWRAPPRVPARRGRVRARPPGRGQPGLGFRPCASAPRKNLRRPAVRARRRGPPPPGSSAPDSAACRRDRCSACVRIRSARADPVLGIALPAARQQQPEEPAPQRCRGGPAGGCTPGRSAAGQRAPRPIRPGRGSTTVAQVRIVGQERREGPALVSASIRRRRDGARGGRG